MVTIDHSPVQHNPILESRAFDAEFSETVAIEREWLVRWFLARCGGQDVLAEDLTQETLLTAWRIRARFTAGERGARPWLAAIARNVLLRWQRAAGGVRLAPLDPEALADRLPDADDALDPVWFSEQVELRTALERALETVAPAARALLVRRYLREESIAEIALAEGQIPAHVGVRLQRARNAVRKAIDDLFPADFAEDLAALSPTIATATHTWCPCCGSAKLIKTVWRDGSSYHLRCPVCNTEENAYTMGWFRPRNTVNLGIPGADFVLTHSMSTLDMIDQSFGTIWSKMQRQPTITCPQCDAPTFTRPVPWLPRAEPNPSVEWWCPRCGNLHQSGNLSSVAMNHPRGLAFWREEGQIRTEPLQEATVGGQDAILITLSAVQRSSHITFAYTPDATRLLMIDDRTPSAP